MRNTTRFGAYVLLLTFSTGSHAAALSLHSKNSSERAAPMVMPEPFNRSSGSTSLSEIQPQWVAAQQLFDVNITNRTNNTGIPVTNTSTSQFAWIPGLDEHARVIAFWVGTSTLAAGCLYALYRLFGCYRGYRFDAAMEHENRRTMATFARAREIARNAADIIDLEDFQAPEGKQKVRAGTLETRFHPPPPDD